MKKLLFIALVFMGGILFPKLDAQVSDTLDTEDLLQMSFADLMNIQVVSASKTKESIKDVAATVHVITSEQIRDRAYFTLDEALSDLPGFQFRNIQGFNSYLFLRGAPSQNNLIILMVDGIQINELNSGGFYGGGQFIMSDIEQIEVVYGPASALYGTNAVSGIINIITKKPDGNSVNLSLLGGNFATGNVSFNLKSYQKSKDMGFSLSGQYKTTEKGDFGGESGDNNWTEEMENFENDLSLSGRFKIKNLEVGVDLQEKQSSMTTNFRSVGDIYLDKNTLWDITFLNAYGRYSKDLTEKLLITSTAYFRNATVNSNTINAVIKPTETTTGDQIGYYRPNKLTGVEAQLNFNPSDKLMVIGGVIGETEWLSDGFSVTHSGSWEIAPARPPKPAMINNFLFSYYGQIDYSIFDQLSFIGGIRHDFSNYYGQVFVPRTGLVFNRGKLTAKALYNTAFRSPKPWDYSYGTGNSDLKPERMGSVELDLSYRLGDKLDIGGAVYYNEIKDKLTKETILEIDRWINKDDLSTTGFELYGNYLVGDFNLLANYTYNDSRDQNGVVTPEIAKHSANVGVTYTLDRVLTVNIRANYLGERENPTIITSTGGTKIDDALIINGCLSVLAIKNFNIQLKANNILNVEYYHPSNRFAGRYRQPQRSFTLGVAYNFEWKE